tara:strand:- start:38 stop:568 length:531 start_codon:yes stop_codon:yes gene_type:complete
MASTYYLNIVKQNLKKFKKQVVFPTFLKKNRKRFLTLIWNKFKNKYDTIENKQRYIQCMMSRLRNHFKLKNEQHFLTDINNDKDMLKAVYRVVNNLWVKKEKVFVNRIPLSIPLSCVRIVKGVGVGRGLEESGTMEYYCNACQKIVGNTDTNYWSHMKKVHDTNRVIYKTNKIQFY